MTTYGCGVILFMINLCWSGAQHPASETEILGDGQRKGASAVQEQSCPTWYQKTKRNGVTRCACGASLEGAVVCEDATLETLLIADNCMSYDDTINDTVTGECPFNYHHPDTQIFYITLPNDTSKLNSFMCDGLNRTGLLCSQVSTVWVLLFSLTVGSV